MGQAERTQGKWHIAKTDSTILITCGNRPEEGGYLIVAETTDISEFSLTNARLIAAAPELLFALEYLLQEVCQRNGEPFEGATETAQFAIAAAKGE